MSIPRVPSNFYAGLSDKRVHRGIERRGDVVYLACGMAGTAIGRPQWLYPTGRPVTCKTCVRAMSATRGAE